MSIDVEYFEKQIGYSFNDKSLLVLALTHRSSSRNNNERLEFLGDSILSFLIAEKLLNYFPKASEGQLSRLRAKMVKGKTLAEIGQELGVSDLLQLGLGELKSGENVRCSILADAVEAIIGAIYLDAGLEGCRSCVLHWFANRISSLSPCDQKNKDPKTRLQEYLQSQNRPLPNYTIISQEKKGNEQKFIVLCEIEGMPWRCRGEGVNRKDAEQKAAWQTLQAWE